MKKSLLSLSMLRCGCVGVVFTGVAFSISCMQHWRNAANLLQRVEKERFETKAPRFLFCFGENCMELIRLIYELSGKMTSSFLPVSCW